MRKSNKFEMERNKIGIGGLLINFNVRHFQNIAALRCFAFEPLNYEIDHEIKQKEHLIMFPSGDDRHMKQQIEVLMHDFAACILIELQQRMLKLSIGMMNLATVIDKTEFFGYDVNFDSSKKYSNDELKELKYKRKYVRLQKLLGDWCMLSGTPRDAAEHYNTCIEIARQCSENIWCAAAYEGLAEAKIIDGLVTKDLMRKRIELLKKNRLSEEKNNIILQNEIIQDAANFLNESSQIETPILIYFKEAESLYDKHCIFPLKIGINIKLAKLLLKKESENYKLEIMNLLTKIISIWPLLKSESDRIIVITECSNILTLMGMFRKRALLLWQALENDSDSQNLKTTMISLISDKIVNVNDKEKLQNGFLTSFVLPKPYWIILHQAFLESLLPIFLKISDTICIWECAASLMRDHYAFISAENQEKLIETLKIASYNLESSCGSIRVGPPPLFQVRNISDLEQHLVPVELIELDDKNEDEYESEPFIFNPYASRRKNNINKKNSNLWVVGEECCLEVYISNPCSIQLKIERLCLCAEDPITKELNKNVEPVSVAVILPPKTKPTRVSLTIVPLKAGQLRIIGCNVTLFGVTWLQKFITSLRRLPKTPGISIVNPDWGLEKNMVIDIKVIHSLPLLKSSLLSINSEYNAKNVKNSMIPQEKYNKNVPPIHLRSGEHLMFYICIQNDSRFNISKIYIQSKLERFANKYFLCHGNGVKLNLDNDIVINSLPLKSDEYIKIPTFVFANYKYADTETLNSQIETIRSEILIKYKGDVKDSAYEEYKVFESDKFQLDKKESIYDNDFISNYGRELSIPLIFKVHPVAKIVSIKIYEHYVPIKLKTKFKSYLSKDLFMEKIFDGSDKNCSGIKFKVEKSGVVEELKSSIISYNELLEHDVNFENISKEKHTSRTVSDMEMTSEESNELEELIVNFDYVCNISFTVANMDNQVLSVWTGFINPNNAPDFSKQWKAPLPPASHSVVPGHIVEIYESIPTIPPEFLPSGQKFYNYSYMENIISEWIRNNICVFWQTIMQQPTFDLNIESEKDLDVSLTPKFGAQGIVPIHEDQIRGLLNPRVASIISQNFATFSVLLCEPYSRSFTDIQSYYSYIMSSKVNDTSLSYLPNNNESMSSLGPNGENWGIIIKIGEFLKCQIYAENNTSQKIEGKLNLCCERLDDDSDGGSDILFKSEGFLLDPGVVIIGKISNIPFTILPKHSFIQKFDICFSSPGLYQTYVISDIAHANDLSSNDLLTVQGFKLNILCVDRDNFQL